MSRTLGTAIMLIGIVMIAFSLLLPPVSPPGQQPGPNQVEILVQAVDSSYNPIKAGISVNGSFLGTGTGKFLGDKGKVYRVSFDDFQGYVKPSDIFVTPGDYVGGDKIACNSVNTNTMRCDRQNAKVFGIYTALIIPTGNVQVYTVDESGKSLPGPIYVDGQFKGTGYAFMTLNAGKHIIGFGSLPGYTTPQSQEIYIAGNENLVIKGVYISPQKPTTTLTVIVTVCSIRLNTCWSEQGARITLSDGQLGYTNIDGRAQFTVLQNTTYTVSVQSVYGNAQRQINVGTQPISTEFQFATSGLSIFPLSSIALGSSSLTLLAVGMMLTLLGLYIRMRARA